MATDPALLECRDHIGIFVYSSYSFYKGNQSGDFFFAALVVFVIIHANIAAVPLQITLFCVYLYKIQFVSWWC